MPKSWLSSKYYAELDTVRGSPMPGCGTSNHALPLKSPAVRDLDFQFIMDEPKV